MNFRWLFYPFLMFLLGINVVRNIFNGQIEYIVVTAILAVLLALYCIIKKYFKQMAALIICLIVGGCWYFVGISQSFNTKEYVGKTAVVGRITDNISEDKYSYTVVLDHVKIDGKNEANVSVEITNCYNLPKVGSFISFESQLENVHAFTLGSFNSSCYRSGVRYYANCNYKYAVVADGYQTFDEQVRLSIKQSLYANMTEVNAATAYASLFGDKNNLDGDVYSSYQGAGIIHILTVSGLHVSFLISLIFGLLKKCKVNKYANLAITIIFIFFYAYLCNWTPSVLRAGIMGIVFMLSKLFGRKYDGLNSLGLAGFIICLFRPLSGLDVGFLMSVFCVVGINVIMPVVQRLLKKIIPKACGDTLAVGIAAQVGIFPLLCLMGGSINILSIFANLLVVPIFGAVYPLLFAISFLSLILPFMAKLLIVVDWAFSLILLLAQFFNVEQTKFYLKNMGYLNLLLFYIASFIVSDYLILLGSGKFIAFSVVLLCFAFSCVGGYFTTNRLPTISYISQYGKSSVVLKSEGGQTMVVGDCYLMGRLAQRYKTGFDVFVASQGVTASRYDALQDEYFGSFVSFEEGTFSENFVLELDKEYILGDFNLTYISLSDEMVGVRINFDNLEIFIASEENLSYNEFKDINNKYHFNLVFANYALGEGEFKHVANKYVDGCDYSFNKLGNMAFGGDKLNFRRLD